MRRWLLIATLAAAGCWSGSGDDIDPVVALDFTSDQPLDRIEVYAADLAAETGPITPGRRARGDLASESAFVGYALTWGRDFTGGGTTYHLEFDSFYLPRQIVAVGLRRDGSGVLQVVAAGDVLDGVGVLTARRAAEVEAWGGADGRCLRFADSTPRYFVRGSDFDCDGLRADGDCDDLDHCDLDAPTAAARAGCVIDRCQPCLDDTPGACAIGTHAVCRDDAAGAMSYTCDADPACGGASTCLSEGSCGPGLACRGDWPDTDPRACLWARWMQGAALPDAIICDLPTQPSEFDPTNALLCQPSSVVEVPLPYTACADPRVVIAMDAYEATTASIAPPCTLRIELAPTQRVALTERPVVVTFDTAAGVATARFQLVPKLGTCGTTGACSRLPATGICER
ncbi:MAG: hypothetical protein JNK64_41830 [Myxococcales bacterium]|nr:hypothetical protein [Myxococcales bacterium]